MKTGTDALAEAKSRHLGFTHRFATPASLVLMASIAPLQLRGQEVDITGYVEHTFQIDYASTVKEQMIDASSSEQTSI
jgi:hypothetical protein